MVTKPAMNVESSYVAVHRSRVLLVRVVPGAAKDWKDAPVQPARLVKTERRANRGLLVLKGLQGRQGPPDRRALPVFRAIKGYKGQKAIQEQRALSELLPGLIQPCKLCLITPPKETLANFIWLTKQAICMYGTC